MCGNLYHGVEYKLSIIKILTIRNYRDIVLQDDEEQTFCTAAESFKERARMRNLAGSYPGPYLPLSPAVVSNARRGTIGFKESLSATMKSASGAARSISLYRAFVGV